MLPLPELQQSLKEIIKGQDQAINELTIAFYKYLLKIQAKNFGYYFNNSTTVLLNGSTGTGKTLLCRTLAEYINLPFIEINAKSISLEGWFGKSFIKILSEEFPMHRNGGIIFIDEIDKMLGQLSSTDTANWNYHLQTSLLKYVEGMTIRLNKEGLPLSYKELNTSNFIFIFAGAFVGLDLDEEKSIGFKNGSFKKPLMTDALIKFGMIPELAGRIQHIISLKEIEKTTYEDILNSESFILNKYLKMLTKFDIHGIVNKNELISKAIEKKLGVRGLIQEVELLITSMIQENPKKLDFEKLSPLYTPKQGKL